MLKVVKDILKAWREAKSIEGGRIRQVVAERGDEIYRDPDSYVLGNPQGDITLTEFFDYR